MAVSSSNTRDTAEGMGKKLMRRMVFKLIAVGVLFFILGSVAVYSIGFAAEEINDRYNEAQQVRQCDRLYYQKEYGSLRDHLMLFELYSAPFDVHWEAADGYGDYQEYLQWRRAQEKGMDGSREQVEQYGERVRTNAEKCRFEQNRRILEEYAASLEEG